MNLRTTLALVGTLVLGASCTSGTEGIFASIEREQKIVSVGGISSTATITHMAELVDGSVDRYFATGGRYLFYKDVTNTNWIATTVGGSSEVAAVGITGTKIWAIAGGTLYSSSDDGTTWVAQGLESGDTAYGLVPVRKGDGISADELIVVARYTSGSANTVGSMSNVYKISSTGTLGSALNLGSNLKAAVVSSIIDNTGAYYLVSENFVWQVDSAFGTKTQLTLSGAPASGYAGMIYLNNVGAGYSGYYLSTLSNADTGGGIYKAGAAASGGTMVYGTIKNEATSTGGYIVSFSQMLYNSVNQSLWVATGSSHTLEGTGYMEITLSSSGDSYANWPTTNSSNYSSSDIPTAAVGILFKGSTGYFLGTLSYGLWKWDDGGSSGLWTQQ